MQTVEGKAELHRLPIAKRTGRGSTPRFRDRTVGVPDVFDA